LTFAGERFIMNMNAKPKNCIVQIYKEVFIHIKIIRHKINRPDAVTASRRILIFIFGEIG